MKYKLINNKTQEEHLCNKVTIDGFDYYVSDDEIKVGDYYLTFTNKTVMGNVRRCEDSSYNFTHCKKVIVTNNPNIDVPKVVDKAELLAKNIYRDNPTGRKDAIYRYNTDINAPRKRKAFVKGYNKSQETHPNSDEDMVEFAKWLRQEDTEVNAEKYANFTDADMLQLWREQKPKTVYYE